MTDAAERTNALVDRVPDLEEQVIAKAEEKLDRIDGKDRANAFKNFAIGSGVLQDEADRLPGKPAALVEHRVEWRRSTPYCASLG